MPAWTPPAVAPSPQVAHVRPTAARVGQPLALTVQVTAPAGIDTVRLRYRHVTQFEDYATLAMTRIGTTDDYTATAPGDFLVPQWDFMYFIEATDRTGRGVQWPDLAVEAPYVIVPLARP